MTRSGLHTTVLLICLYFYDVFGNHLGNDVPKVNPEEQGELFEGDIQRSSFRNAVSDLVKTWPDGIVPFTIDAKSDYSDYQKRVLKRAMARIEEATAVNGKKCIQFVKRSGQRDYIKIKKVKGCSSDVGRKTGMQEVSLSYGCFLRGTVMHELLHVLGFWHEQNRADRDEFVTIMWDNIKALHASNFKRKTLNKETHHMSMPYDYGSIMHYSERAFSKDGRKITILAHDPYAKIGQREDLSPIDIKEIQTLYGCIEGDRPTTHTKEKVVPEKDKKDAILHCDFENGWCGAKATTDGGVEWELDSARRTDGVETGPDGDHTSGSGTYAVVRNRNNPGTSARLRFPLLEQSESGYCVDLWYNLYGEDAGMLVVNDGGSPVDIVFGDQGGDWVHGQYTVRRKDGIELGIEAVWGPDYSGDVGLDDISIYKGPC